MVILALTGHSAEAQLAGGIGVGMIAPITALLAQLGRGDQGDRPEPPTPTTTPSPIQLTVHVHQSAVDYRPVGPPGQ